jgi:hypothetical protein
VVVVKFETRAQKEARTIPLHTRREGGSASQERRTPGPAHEKKKREKKKEKEGLQIRSSPVDATRRGGALQIRPAARPRGNAARIVVGVEAGSAEAGRAGVVQAASVSIGGREGGGGAGGGFGERKERRMRRGRESPGVGLGCCCAAQAAGKGRRASRERAARHVFRYRCRPRLPPAAFDF